ncbi:S8 family serine peptidase [Bradyrhizobium canariense]|uniref:Subtilase family protein n=1 Tax=Bradyrhizobium canariense TaxID=255045 RepID=A0A1H1TIC9_9BRAD|nr:S8 family serine peptidase [Bradyrhizobium canariense]SDS59948.1 Subtilase family protein [Bradyrhizobium canariense]
MTHNCANWRMKARAVAALTASAVVLLACLGGSMVHAQSIMRSPNLNIGPRLPRINSNIAPRVNPNIAGRVVTNVGRGTPGAGARISSMRSVPRIGVRSTLPYLHYSPNLYPVCDDVGGDAACWDQPVSLADGGAGATARGRGGDPRRGAPQAALNLRTIPNQIVAEIDGTLSDAQADELARRHGLARLQSQNFPLIGGTIGLFRVTDRRSVETASRELATDASVRSVQPNFRYVLQDQKAALTEGDPAQYALAKLRLPEAHTLVHGANVRVAVIDSGIDVKHPELTNAIADSFDALGSKEGPHPHGTGIAGAIVAHARLMGSAPAAKILAIRAFGVAANGAESTSFIILKGLDYAAGHGAQIINMSFAGPKDALIERGIAAVAAKGIVMVAAAGNAGPKSPPLYPAANADVIAVSATDAQDKLFSASNRGGYIAVAAPGVDIFLPAPDDKYQMTSGTSFSAAYISGLAALVLERNPALKPEEVRGILTKTAHDLGTPGRDDLFGAGEADAYAAVIAVANTQAPSVAAASDKPATEKVTTEKTLDPQSVPATRALNQPAIAADKPAVGEAGRPAAQ